MRSAGEMPELTRDAQLGPPLCQESRFAIFLTCWHSFKQSSRIGVHDVPQLWKGDDRLDAGRALGYPGHYRCVHCVPSVLVRSAQELAAHSRLDPQADEVYRRTLINGQANLVGRAAVPAMRRPAVTVTRYGPEHAIQLLGMWKSSWTVHRVLRLPEREKFHPRALASGDPAAEPECTECELLQLWGVHRPADQLSLPVLSFRHFDAGHEAAATDASATQGRC